jgi:hypothetical protein
VKVIWGVDVYIHILSISALAGNEWSTSPPRRFNPLERATCAHWVGGWVDPRADLDGVEKRKIFTLPELLIPNPRASSPEVVGATVVK